MPFNPGVKLGSYEISGTLGCGGMGEVYRARDSKLKRDVAIKVLPDAFARDVERLVRFQREERPTAETWLEINAPATVDPASMAVSPDGRKIVFSGIEDGRPRLFLRSFDSPSIQPLAGTEYAQLPFWSPDSRSLGFFSEGKLKRMELEGGSPRVLGDVPQYVGGTWGEGAIFYPKSNGQPVSRLATKGDAQPVDVTRIDQSVETSHRFPQLLGDGRHLLYFVTGGPDVRGVYITPLDQFKPRRLLGADAAAAAIIAPSGQLLFVRQDTLFAQDLDVDRLELVGNPYVVAEHVLVNVGNRAAVSASPAAVQRIGTAGDLRPSVPQLSRQNPRLDARRRTGSMARRRQRIVLSRR